MRIAIATVQVPFIRGGAEIHAEGLFRAIQAAGHSVDLVSMPFRFAPVSEIQRSMKVWASENFEHLNGYHCDRVICLKFPTFYLQHPYKVAWVLHQHREVYDLWGTEFTTELTQSAAGKQLKHEITEQDNKAFSTFQSIYANAKTVSARLQKFNQIASTPLYHPPQDAERFYTAPAEPYMFFLSRLETLKRQDLLIQAMRFVRSPMVALIGGEGGQHAYLQGLIEQFGLQQKVRLIGRLTDAEKLSFYAHCSGVFFAPYNEDYGYVTLEAMLARKPVITCTDSGEPIEFVVNGQTGWVVEPEPEAIAEKIDQLYEQQAIAKEMGVAGYDRYHALDISWNNVVQKLLH
ncbi:glycosyltransferase family 4 protein [Leptolyngbya sp. AN03gr2]|uniref:glycosyltransferase family 4 protein n=1 Tax=unclassified Leptolyngbya TaxID=2650499 RepID=UPI003D324220